MKGREGKGPPSADLLVCFPTRAHLTLMPKPICSPARQSSETSTRHQRRHLHRPIHEHHIRKTTNNNGHSSPLLWSKTKHNNNSDISEPTSPKVTCAGQIKVRPNKPNSSCKNWQSVMEEIERLHNSRKQKKRPAWMEALGVKKDVMQFLTCLRNIRFEFRCFGSFPTTEITSDDDEEDDEDEDEDDIVYGDNTEMGLKDEAEESRTVFSKWFMILQDENNQGKELITSEKDEDDKPIAAPPTNALLLMRCRSAPAKSWLEEKAEKEKVVVEEEEEDNERKEKEEREEEERLVVMRCGTDFSKFSSDIAKETWVVGGIKEMLSRSRSWKR